MEKRNIFQFSLNAKEVARIVAESILLNATIETDSDVNEKNTYTKPGQNFEITWGKTNGLIIKVISNEKNEKPGIKTEEIYQMTIQNSYILEVVREHCITNEKLETTGGNDWVIENVIWNTKIAKENSFLTFSLVNKVPS